MEINKSIDSDPIEFGINETLPLHHRDVEEMFTVTLATGKSVLQILIDNLTGHLKLKGKEYAKLPEVILD